jgi:hypothetical protein
MTERAAVTGVEVWTPLDTDAARIRSASAARLGTQALLVLATVG